MTELGSFYEVGICAIHVSEIYIDCCKIKESFGIVGIDLSGLLQVGNRRARILEGKVSNTAVVVGDNVRRIQLNGFAVVRQGFVILASIIVDDTAVRVRLGIGWIKLDGLTIVGERRIILF